MAGSVHSCRSPSGGSSRTLRTPPTTPVIWVFPRLFPQRDSRYNTPRIGELSPLALEGQGASRRQEQGLQGLLAQRKGAGRRNRALPGSVGLDRNRASRACNRPLLREQCGTARNREERNPEGFLLYPGQEPTSVKKQGKMRTLIFPVRRLCKA